ncbi:hypothetical protein HZA71_02470 [Candidatus Falkowbacteria bacterium]|nr:hypothetical protein [Candidatus Falkowbacteria bacterium]
MPNQVPKPKINLYRNISISFVVFTVMLIFAVVFLFFDNAKIIVQTAAQDVNLSFNVEVKENPTEQELAEKDVISGQEVVREKIGRGEFEVLSTKSGSPGLVGRVKIVNNYSRNQTLVKTTQLQANNDVIVRTAQLVVVPAGGSIMVDVYPKEPENFADIKPGNLTIIKLAKELQDKIYGVVSTPLTDAPPEIKVLAESDINRAKEKLSARLAEEVRKEFNISDKDGVATEIADFKIDKKIGEETDTFNLEAMVKVKSLEMDQNQLVDLLGRKIKGLNLTDMDVSPIDLANLNYAITEPDFGGNILIKINYILKTKLNANNSIFNKNNFAGKGIGEVRQYFKQFAAIKDVQIFNSPYWKKTLPSQKSKIEIIIQ